MHATIFDNSDFVYEAQVQPLTTPPGAFNFSVNSRWRSAKDPKGDHTQLQITLDRDGLVALRQLIDEVVSETDRDASHEHASDAGSGEPLTSAQALARILRHQLKENNNPQVIAKRMRLLQALSSDLKSRPPVDPSPEDKTK